MLAQVDRLIEPLVGEGLCVGLVVGLIDGQTSHVRGYGRFCHTTQRRPDADTLFEIGSITKVFTALLLAEMTERREVALEQPVRTLLPPQVMPGPSGGEEVTLLHLATHT